MKSKEVIVVRKFSIFGDIMFLRATGVLSLNEILCYLARKYPNSRISYQTIQRLYDLATKVQTTGEYSRGFNEFVVAWHTEMDSIHTVENYKTIERYWLVVGYIFNTKKNIKDIWEYLLESDPTITFEITRRFVSNMAKHSSFITTANETYVICWK
jgi:hypothetical protein